MAKLPQLLTRHFKKSEKEATKLQTSVPRAATEAEIAADTTELAVQLSRLNVGQGDHVLVCLEQAEVAAVVEKAVWRLGAQLHRLPATTTAVELEAALQAEPMTAMLVRDDLLGTVKAERSTVTRLVPLKTTTSVTLIRDRSLVGHLPQTTA
ncbi:acyl-CoA synthetase [Lactobacillus brevis] [Lactiplantibacillus mudanjiangensis]|uniref:AMP-binding protein n=1 Tax=Lactiplantibacillus mudanjiangensis TaxID=1296538 RepID=UPI001014A835|nr:acyl-CoA synthetase [Lactobacillus brevis] [Lactiplantibacillus mudanjiangensis]